MLAATSTGSTAYSYSCGGSAIHPSLQVITPRSPQVEWSANERTAHTPHCMQAIVLTPIATRTLPFRPIILPKGPTLKLRVRSTTRPSLFASDECRRCLTAIDVLRRATQLSEYSRDEANVWVDSQRHYRLARGGSVEISASPYPIVTVNRGEEETHDWLKALKGTPPIHPSIRPLHTAHGGRAHTPHTHRTHTANGAHIDAFGRCAGMNRFVEREYAGPDDDHHHSEAGHHHRHH
jgi:hypothetical protein